LRRQEEALQLNMTTDQELVDRLLRGDPRAFEEFFDCYYPKLYRFAKRRVDQDAHAAEDVAQSTICRALESLRTYRGEAALMTWLCTICRREISSRRRDSHMQTTTLTSNEDDPEVRAALESLLTADREDPLVLTSIGQIQEAVLTALDYLPSPYAEILEWKYVQELSVVEIAGRLGRSQKATESLLTRARAAFREAFTLLHVAHPSLAFD
jgi:RNA polymerase sigma-70 factor, ECF subfamily